jgi:two-component system CheB/CheR fusion protein
MLGFFRNSKLVNSLKRRLFPEIEKLVALNNDLQAANQQLRARNHELTQSAGELKDFLISAELPVLIVGRDLRIRTLTTSVERIMNLRPPDIGQLVADIYSNVAVPDLVEVISEVIAQDSVREYEVQCLDGRWYLLRIHPYCTADDVIHAGLSLCFKNIQ